MPKCTSCNGSGDCKKCDGKGYASHDVFGNKVSCSRCRGTGKCTTCKGKGRVS